MLLPLHKIPDNYNVWIFQSNRSIEIDELNEINDAIDFFVEEWKYNEEDVCGFTAVYYRRFIILMVDNLFDTSVINQFSDMLKTLGNYLDIDFFDDTKICYKIGLQDIADFHKEEVIFFINKELLKPETIIFNNTISTKVEFNTTWEQKAIDSKFNSYFL